MKTEKTDLPSYLTSGLVNKYRIEKRDGSPVNQDAKYFVLRYDKDPNAVVAVIAYCKSVTGDNSYFAADLLRSVYIHAKRLGKLEGWAEAAVSVLVRCEAPREKYDEAIVLGKIMAQHAAAESGSGE